MFQLGCLFEQSVSYKNSAACIGQVKSLGRGFTRCFLYPGLWRFSGSFRAWALSFKMWGLSCGLGFAVGDLRCSCFCVPGVVCTNYETS